MKYIIGNWKTNPDSEKEAQELFLELENEVKANGNIEVAICPSFVHLSAVSKIKKNIKLGAQDCWHENREKKNFTGETSLAMLESFGCEYVIVGHSERRSGLNESSATVNKKAKLILEAGLTPIICVEEITQLDQSIEGIDLKSALIAYEPPSAIGTGNIPAYSELKPITEQIRGKVAGTPLLYGGSVNSENVKGFVDESGFDGVLIGGVSLKPIEFGKTVQAVTEI